MAKTAQQTSGSITAATVSAWMGLTAMENPFNVSLAVVISTNSVLTYTVEYVHSDSLNATSSTIFSHPDLTDQSTKLDANIAFPVDAVRLNVTGYTTGSANLIVTQARSYR
jgi:hypothetical protein